jgi:sulfoxide reductase heme-binding subunit YedZ
VSGGIAALIHTVLGLQVHMGGAIMKYFMLPPNPARSTYFFVATNLLGVISSLILLVLVAVSNNFSIRTIGLDRWKRIQRVAYPAAVAAAAHGLLYQLLEKRLLPVVGLTLAITIAVIVLQLQGWRIASRR